MDESQVVFVPMEEVDPPTVAQRLSIDPGKIIELAESIRSIGLQEPILLRPVNGRKEIVFGHRRFLAHQHLGLDRIKSFIREMDDLEVVLVRAVENLQRENLSPLEEARTYNIMREQGGMTVEGICKATGKSDNTVKRYLRFWRMPDDFKQAVDSGGTCLGVAEVLIQVEDPYLRKEWLRMAVENGITVVVAELWVSDYQKSKAGNRFEGVGDVAEGELDVVAKPVYVTCEVCLNPVEIRVARQIVCCAECRKKVRHV